MSHSKRNPPRSSPTSSILSSSRQSKHLTKGSLIITIRYLCPHCSEVHFLDFPMSSSTKRKTSTPRIMQCSTSSLKVGSVQSVILSKASMVFVELYNKECKASKPNSTAKKGTLASRLDALELSSKRRTGEYLAING